MKSVYLVIASTLALAACDPTMREQKPAVWPSDLKDCKVYSIFDPKMQVSRLVIVRCPNSQTAVSQRDGKVDSAIVTVDGGV